MILLMGASLRFYHIDTESLWADEGFTIYTSSHVMEFLASNDKMHAGYIEITPPLYFVMMHYWIKIFGKSVISIRTPSVAAGILSLYLIFLLGKVLYDKKTGLFAALLLAFSVYNIFNVSQEARPYAFLNLFALCSYYYLWKWYEEGGSKNGVFYGISTFLLLYTHNYGLFIMLGQNIYMCVALLFFRDSARSGHLDWKKWLLSQAVILLTFAPWAWFTFLQMTGPMSAQNRWHEPPRLVDLYRDVSIFTNLSLILFILACILVALSIHPVLKPTFKKEDGDLDSMIENISWRDMPGENRQFLLLFVWFISVLVIPFIVSLTITPIYNYRYIIPASLALYLMMARGLSSIQKRYVSSVMVVFILVLSFNAMIPYYRVPMKEQWKEVVHKIENAAEPGDLVLICSGILLTNCYNYYAKRTDVDVQPFPARSLSIYTTYTVIDQNDVDELRGTAEKRDYVWLVLSTHHKDPENLISRTLQKDFRTIMVQDFRAIQVILMENRRIKKGK